MHLVPESALVENTATQQRTFADMRQAMVLKYNTKTKRTFGDDPQNAEATGVSIGCGFADTNNVKDSDQAVGRQPQPAKTARRRLQHVENGGACNNQTNFYCWMSCLDIPEADRAQGYINEGYSLYCVDPLVLASSGNRVSKAVEPCNEAGVIGGAMNTICVGSWQPTAPGVPPQQVAVDYPEGYTVEEPFCYGGTSMYMDGFQWLGSTCPIYLFPSLVLDSAQALILACIFTIVFGISLEWFIQRRRVIAKRLEPGYGRLCVSACLYGVQLTMGYTIMLVVMIYSIPLFLSVVVGIVGGHVLFSAQDAVVPSCLSASAAEASLKEDDEDAMGVSHFCSESSSIIEGFGSGPTTANSTNNESTYQPITGQNVNGSSSPGQDDSGVAEGSTPCCQHTV